MYRLYFLFFLLLLGTIPAHGETVLVLPFFNLPNSSNSSNLDWIGESVAETVRESLTSEGVLALDRDSRQEAYRRLGIRPYALITRASIIKLGEALDVGRVVYGTFEVKTASAESAPSKGSLRIVERMLDLRKMKQDPEISATGPLEDLATLQDGVAWQTLTRLMPAEKMPSEEQFRAGRRPVRLDAMENYIRGLLTADADQRHRFFTQAARLDPKYSQPCFQLGRLRLEKKDYRAAAGWLERVGTKDPNYRKAIFLIGVCRYHMADYEKAKTAFESVLQQFPLSEVWNDLGAAQSRLGLPEALESFEKALEGDSNDPVYNFNVGYALWRLGEFEEAADSFRAVLDRSPEDPVTMTMLGRCLKKSGPGRAEARVEALERLKYNFDEMAYRQLQAVLSEGNR